MPLDQPPHIDKQVGIEIVADTNPCKLVRTDDSKRVKLIARCPGYPDINIVDMDVKIEKQSPGPFTILELNLPQDQLPTLNDAAPLKLPR